MNGLRTRWWRLDLPPEWEAESGADSSLESVLIGDRDGVGCIEISTLHRRGGHFNAAELESIAHAGGDKDWRWEPVNCGDFRGWTTSYVAGDEAVREWYVAAGPVILFVTYSCAPENRDLDAAAVNEILATLTAPAAFAAIA